MTTKKIYTAEDFNPMSWTEFGEILSELKQKVEHLSDNRTAPIDTVVPVLRSGAIIGYPISVALGIKNIAPVSVIRGTPTFSQESADKLQNSRHILFCEASIVTGTTANNLSDLFAKQFLTIERSFLALSCAFKSDTNIKGYKNVLIGTYTNERKTASLQEIKQYHLREGIPLFPWESLERELQEINA